MTKSKALPSVEMRKKQDPSWNAESDDDDAPDAVSFNQGREEALESISNALQDLQRTKLKAKERRRERDKRLKEQKQKKKVSLSKARLPQDLLTKLSQQQDTQLETSDQSQSLEQPQTEKTGSPKEAGDEGDEDDFDMDNEEDWEEMKHQSNIHVIQSSKIVHPPPHEAALQFLKTQMYGSRTPRESMAKNISRKLKRHGKPSMNFYQHKPQGIKKKRK